MSQQEVPQRCPFAGKKVAKQVSQETGYCASCSFLCGCPKLSFEVLKRTLEIATVQEKSRGTNFSYDSSSYWREKTNSFISKKDSCIIHPLALPENGERCGFPTL